MNKPERGPYYSTESVIALSECTTLKYTVHVSIYECFVSGDLSLLKINLADVETYRSFGSCTSI